MERAIYLKKIMVTILHLIFLSSFYDLIFLMESTWKKSCKIS